MSMIKKIGPGINTETAKRIWISIIERVKLSIGKGDKKNPLPTALSFALQDVVFETHQSFNGVDFVNPEYHTLVDMRWISNRVIQITLRVGENNILGYYYFNKDYEYSLYFPISTNLIEPIESEIKSPVKYRLLISFMGGGPYVNDEDKEKVTKLMGVKDPDFTDVFFLRNKLSNYTPNKNDSWEEFKKVVGYFDLLEYEAL